MGASVIIISPLPQSQTSGSTCIKLPNVFVCRLSMNLLCLFSIHLGHIYAMCSNHKARDGHVHVAERDSRVCRMKF